MTTPAQPESKTPVTDNARFRATTERPESGDYELEVVYAEVAEKLETELNAARVQAEADRREIADWKRLYYHAIDHQEWALLGSIRKQLVTAQQRIKELEEDEHRLDWLENQGIWAAQNDEHSWAISVIGNPGKESTLRMTIRAVIDELKNH